jgi:F0F1-type ATP synthase delta subunit
VLRIRSYSDLQVLDPLNRLAQPEGDIMDAIFANLVKAKPGEAWDWQLDAAEAIEQVDERHIEFTLRKGIQFTGGFGELTAKFLGVVAEHRRLFALPGVIEAYRAMLAEHKGEVGAELVSAVPLQEQQVATLEKQLSTAVGKQVTLSARVDPGLLGGLVVRVGSRMLDASLRTKLRQLELAMKGAA